MTKVINDWFSKRFGVDVIRWKQRTREEIEASGEFERPYHDVGYGHTYKSKKHARPSLLINVRKEKPHSITVEFKVTQPTEWDEMETLIRDASALAGEVICSAEEFKTMRKGRLQTGRVFKLDDGSFFSVQIDGKFVSITN